MSEVQSIVEYRNIPDWPGYRAGNDGSIWCCRSLNGIGPLKKEWRLLRPGLDRDGYCHVTLRKNGKKVYRAVHRLVLEAFVGPCPAGMQCRHFPDRTRTNNTIANLSWSTPKQNSQDKIVHGTSLVGTKNPMAELTEEQVAAIRQEYSLGKVSLRQLGRKYKKSEGMICFIVHRKNWKHVV